jgi:peptidoglycan hydrolase FlgJ
MAVDPSNSAAASAALSPALAQQLAERASGQLAQDQRSLDSLQRAARDNPRAAIRQAAVQFQALFVQQVLKSMRDSTVKSGLFESHANDTYQSMLDQQLSVKVASGAKGLTDVIASQLSRSLPQEPGTSTTSGAPAPAALQPLHAAVARAAATTSDAAAAAAATTATVATPGPTLAQIAAARAQQAVAAAAGCAWFAGDEAAESNSGDDGSLTAPAAAAASSNASAIGAAASASDSLATGAAGTAANGAGSDATRAAFVARLGKHARVAEQLTGIPAQFILGQAALETGWGKHEMRSASGASSHNLFGIKAGPDWNGRTVTVATTEYQNGVRKRVVQQFRAYNSDADSFRDWAQLVAGSPRYAGVIRHGRTASGFAQGLQQAGYATDPAYGSKLMHTINTLSPSLSPPSGVLMAGPGLKSAGPTPT